MTYSVVNPATGESIPFSPEAALGFVKLCRQFAHFPAWSGLND